MFKLLSSIGAGAVLLLAVPAFAQHRIGMDCVNDHYQNDWLGELPNSWPLCSAFHGYMSNWTSYPMVWFGDLTNFEAFYWETSGDSAPSRGLDDVNLYFAVTHAGPDHFSGPHQTDWAMWDVEDWAHSQYMRLGDTGAGPLSVFSTVSCSTMLMDAYLWERWYHIFYGGLRIASGSHGDMTADTCTGLAYASRLYQGFSFWDSWSAATTCSNSTNPTMVLATGANQNDCFSRAANMNWLNYNNGNYPVLRNSQVGSMCGYYAN